MEKMRLEILVPSNKAACGLSHEEKRQKFYNVLFLGEPRCFSPYVNEATSDCMDRADVRLRSPQSKEILKEVISKFRFGGSNTNKLRR
jgi:heat shock protein HspQ